MTATEKLAEDIGRFREILGTIAENGPGTPIADDYRELRKQLLADDRAADLLPSFVVECRSPRDFWNYIQLAFATYAERSQYITAHLLPVERQFPPEG